MQDGPSLTISVHLKPTTRMVGRMLDGSSPPGTAIIDMDTVTLFARDLEALDRLLDAVHTARTALARAQGARER